MTKQQAMVIPENRVPFRNNQVPGYYRIMVGEFEVTALYDGWLSIGVDTYENHTPRSRKELDELVRNHFMNVMTDGGLNTAVSGYLINTGRNLVLLDAGSGDSKDENVGKLVESLRAAGYSPDDVDTIIPTHMHFDHFSGVTVGGERVFKNATVYLNRVEKVFWLETPYEEIPEHEHQYVQMARDAVAPYLAANRVIFYENNTEIIPGFFGESFAGHTPGHNAIRVVSGKSEILIWGDLLHNHALQLMDPSIAADFDVTATDAAKSRERALAAVERDRTLIAGAHLPFPGFGHIRKAGDGYAWVPVEYMPLELSRY